MGDKKRTTATNKKKKTKWPSIKTRGPCSTDCTEQAPYFFPRTVVCRAATNLPPPFWHLLSRDWKMTLAIISKLSIPRKFFCSLNYLRTFDINSKVGFILFPFPTRHFHFTVALNSKIFNADGNVGSKGVTTGSDCNIKSSNVLFQNQILKIIIENPGVFRDSGWVVLDCFRTLVVDPDLFLSVINSIRNRPKTVLKIFRWAEGQKGFNHSEFVVCSALEVLVLNGLMSPAYWVVEKVIDVKMLDIVGALIDGYLNERVSVAILDLILWYFTKESDVERCLWLWDQMVKNELLPDAKNCNRILRMLRDRNLVGKACELYELMDLYGIKPTVVTYSTVLDLFCQLRDLQKALDILIEMQKKGCRPNDITYNAMINGLSKKRDFDKAKELIMEMLNKGLNISACTHNSLISENGRKGMLVETLGLVEEMKTRGAVPTVSTYNALMLGYCRQGRVGHARQWIPVMLKKNLELDVISYNTLIYGYCLLGDVSEALFLLSKLRERNLSPTAVTYNTIIDGFSKIGDLERAKKMKAEMIGQGISPDIFTYTILISCSCKTGNLCMAKEFYDEMLQRGLKPDHVAHATCVAGKLKLGET